jgi:RNA polymerase primary sigma factor
MQLAALPTNRRPRFARTKVQTPLETYLGEIDETRLLAAEEEKELALRVQEGDVEARDHMARANLRLVVHVARGYAGQGVGLQDLIAEGNLGLMRAIEGFDPDMGTRFSTYASYWIKQSIKRMVVNTGKTVRIPAYMHELLVKWRRATAELQDQLGRPPTNEEIAARLNLSKKKLAIIQKAIRIHNAAPQTDSEVDSQSVDATFMDDKSPAPDAHMAKVDDLNQVMELLEHLDAREAAVLRLRFGLAGQEPMTLKAIGDHLGLTRERVRQIEGESLAKLRNGMPDD